MQIETPALLTPTAAEYSMTPTGLEYVLGNYQTTPTTNDLGLEPNETEHIQYAQQQRGDTINNEETNNGKVVPQVSW